MKALDLFIFESFVNKTLKRSIFKKLTKTRSLRSPYQTPSARGISLTGNHTATQATNHGLVLITFCFLGNQRKVQILDKQQSNSQVIVSGVPSLREKERTPDRRLV